MPQISVVIPTYNRAEVLRRTLNLLDTQTLPATEFEVVVIDDGSTDDTPRLLAEFAEKSSFTLRHESQANAGQGSARNRALDLVAGQIVLFLGDDMLPTPTTLEDHLRFHILHPEMEAACLGHVRWHEEIEVTPFMRWLERSGVQFRFHDLLRGQPTDYRRFYTANLSVKRQLLDGEKFDTDFSGWGFEDTELGYRLQKKGMKLIYWPDALVSHLHEISDESLEKRQFQAGQNAVLFQSKHPEAGIIPTGFRFLTQKILAKILPGYWARAKRAFLSGVATAQAKL